MDKALKSILDLIASWDATNLELANSLLKTNPPLQSSLAHYLEPISSMIKGWKASDILELQSFPQRLQREYNRQYKRIDWSSYAFFFQQMPIKKLSYSFGVLSQIPAWIFEVRQLEVLELHDHKIDRIPKEITNLQKLKTLNLGHNFIRKLPPFIGELSQLEYLNLNHNYIHELPEEIGQLLQLEDLHLKANFIYELPQSLLNLKKLEGLNLARTPLGERLGLHDLVYVSVEDEAFSTYLTKENK